MKFRVKFANEHIIYTIIKILILIPIMLICIFDTGLWIQIYEVEYTPSLFFFFLYNHVRYVENMSLDCMGELLDELDIKYFKYRSFSRNHIFENDNVILSLLSNPNNSISTFCRLDIEDQTDGNWNFVIDRIFFYKLHIFFPYRP